MYDTLINPLPSTNTLTSLLIWVYEYVTHEWLIIWWYAYDAIFNQGFSPICLWSNRWIPTKSSDTYVFNRLVFSLPFHFNHKCIFHDWIVSNPFTFVYTYWVYPVPSAEYILLQTINFLNSRHIIGVSVNDWLECTLHTWVIMETHGSWVING